MNTLSRIAELQAKEKAYAAQIKEWKSERDALVASLDLGLMAEGDIVAEVKETVRFDAATAKSALTPELFNAICVSTPSAALAKKVLTGYEFSDCQRVTGRSITFKEGV